MSLDQKNYQKLEKNLSQAYFRLQQARSQIYEGRDFSTRPSYYESIADEIDDLLDRITDLEEQEKLESIRKQDEKEQS